MPYYGIDQTGAVVNKSKAKPLKACELIYKDNNLFDVVFFNIDHLGHWISKLNSSQKNHIFIDCVLGLPIDLFDNKNNLQIRDWIKKSENFNYNQMNYGLKTSESFFNDIKKYYKLSPENLPKRSTEIKLSSNSVFTTRPYQKNIQTGTYRIWKEIAPILDHILIWPIDFYLESELNTVVYEVYPSYFYRKLFNLKTRNSTPLLEAFKKIQQINTNFDFNSKAKTLNDPDYCDAFIAALGGYTSIQEKNIWYNLPPNSFFEGEILN